MKNRNPLLAAGLLLGLGLGGFFDGIVFHQILQVHNMLSNIYFPNTLAKAEINMFWDGIFHAFTWLLTLIGIFMLWKAMNEKTTKESWHYFTGLMLIGWGIFNLVEGVIDHLILQVHHVIQRASSTGQFYSDMIFLLSGILLCGIGVWLCKKNN
ncbi:MAG: DUF2243 domain-containing protein [Tatlockia sp.]|nr:DUF2243 domain-containing protein [Tatlockia sp.]